MFVMLYVLLVVTWVLSVAGLVAASLGYGPVTEASTALLFLAIVSSEIASILLEHRRQIRALSARLDELASARKGT